jgi:uncharacterized protein (DUF302 family)
MFRLAMTVLSVVLLVSTANAMDGMIELRSAHAPHASVDRLEAIAKARGMKVFVRIDHAAGAHSIGQKLRPTELIIFGDPRGGTPLMLCSQTYGLDLPLRVLAWEDAKGASWLGYRDLATLGHAHPDAGCDEALKRLTTILDDLVREAAKP